jgi:hypothetical protein
MNDIRASCVRGATTRLTTRLMSSDEVVPLTTFSPGRFQIGCH